MPLKPIDVDPNNFVFADEEPPQEQPGYLQQAAQFGKNLLGTAAAAPSKLLETTAAITGGPKPYGKLGVFEEEYKNPEKIKPSSESIKETFNVQEPQGLASRAIHSTVENWPLLLFGGGPAALRIGSDLAASAGMHAAKDLGAGTIGQIGASVLAAKGFGNLAGSLKKSLKQPSKIKDFTTKLYDQEKELGSAIEASPRKLFQPLGQLYDTVEKKFVNPSTFSEAAKNRSLENIKTAADLISKPNLTASDVFDVKKLLNEVWAPKKSIEGKIYNDLRNVFKNELDSLARKPDNKKWADSFRSADELYGISKWQTGLGRKLDMLTESNKIAKLVTNPTAQGALGVLAGITFGTKAAAVPAGLLAAKAGIKGYEAGSRGAQFLNTLMRTKDGQKLLWDIAAESTKDSTRGIVSSINKLNHKAEVWDKENPIKENVGLKPVEIDRSKYVFAD